MTLVRVVRVIFRVLHKLVRCILCPLSYAAGLIRYPYGLLMNHCGCEHADEPPGHGTLAHGKGGSVPTEPTDPATGGWVSGWGHRDHH